MKTFAFSCDSARVSITDIQSEFTTLTGAEQQSQYHPLIWLDGERHRYPMAVLQISATFRGHEQWQLTLASSGGGRAEPSEHTVLCVESALVLIVGRFAVRIKVETGDVEWIQECDDSVCFEIAPALDDRALIVHGELEITKLSIEGTIVWQTSGADIFTGPLSIEPGRITATDFYGNVYSINPASGENHIVGQSKPSPH